MKLMETMSRERFGGKKHGLLTYINERITYELQQTIEHG